MYLTSTRYTVGITQRVYIQTFARVAEHLSVSPLEITTCANIVCTIFTYVFWFKKPFDVREPVDLTLLSYQSTDVKKQEEPGGHMVDSLEEAEKLRPSEDLDKLFAELKILPTTNLAEIKIKNKWAYLCEFKFRKYQLQNF